MQGSQYQIFNPPPPPSDRELIEKLVKTFSELRTYQTAFFEAKKKGKDNKPALMASIRLEKKVAKMLQNIDSHYPDRPAHFAPPEIEFLVAAADMLSAQALYWKKRTDENLMASIWAEKKVDLTLNPLVF